MRRISLFLAITLFSICLVSPSYAKSKYKYVPAVEVSADVDTAYLDPDPGESFGLTIEAGAIDAGCFYYLSKITVYGNPKGGTIAVLLLLADLETGLLYDMYGDLLTEFPAVQLFVSGSNALEYDIPTKKGVKKKRNYSWILLVELEKGDDDLPEVYGFKYK